MTGPAGPGPCNALYRVHHAAVAVLQPSQESLWRQLHCLLISMVVGNITFHPLALVADYWLEISYSA